VPAFAMACANVLAQALVVERSRGESQEFAGRLQTCIWGSREAGAILSSFVGGWLLSFVSAKQVFLIAALLPLALVLVAVVVQEEQDARESASWTDVRENLIKAGRAFQHPQIWKPCAFLFFLHATPLLVHRCCPVLAQLSRDHASGRLRLFSPRGLVLRLSPAVDEIC